jgi:hypothetical protein
MTLIVHDVLFVGMHKPSYGEAVNAAEQWASANLPPRESLTYFDTSFLQAAQLAEKLPNLTAIYIANEVGMRRDVAHAACRSLMERLKNRSEKPVIVVSGDMLDVIDDFNAGGYIVELKSEDGTIEEALQTHIL